MTTQEFNAFIQAQGLTDEFTQTPIATADDWFGPGWYDITAQLITDLIAMGWDKQVAQVKEKFGGGRFYIGAGSREIHARIMQWENQTFEICEFCGTKDAVTTAGVPRWIKTLCDNCRQALLQKTTNHENL